MNNPYHNKNILVAGAAKSGVSAAALLQSLGAKVTLSDSNPEEKIKVDLSFLDPSVVFFFGKNPDDIVTDFDMLVLSPGVSYSLPFVVKALAAKIPVIGEFEFAASLCKAPVIAITGTNGKTTTTALVTEIIKLEYPRSEAVGNIGVPFSSRCLLTDENIFAVAEASSYQLETIKDFHPRVAAVLNITPDHLTRHLTMENYARIKARITLNQTYNDHLILNYDNELTRAIKSRARITMFSRMHILGEGFFAENGALIYKENGKRHVICEVSELNITGAHSVENALAAAAVCFRAGISLENIRKGLLSFQPVEHRIEPVRVLNGVKFYNDSKATNPDSSIAALNSIDNPIILIAGGSFKDVDYSPWVRLFDGKVKRLILIGDTADEIEDCCKKHNYAKIDRANSLKSATELAYAAASAGECVLLSPACASFDMFDNYEQRGDYFKTFVRELD